MLKRFPHDSLALPDRQSIAEGDLEIRQRDFSSMPINDRHQPPESMRQTKTSLAREQRNQFRRDKQSGPLKPMAKSFPTRTHWRILAPRRGGFQTAEINKRWFRKCPPCQRRLIDLILFD